MIPTHVLRALPDFKLDVIKKFWSAETDIHAIVIDHATLELVVARFMCDADGMIDAKSKLKVKLAYPKAFGLRTFAPKKLLRKKDLPGQSWKFAAYILLTATAQHEFALATGVDLSSRTIPTLILNEGRFEAIVKEILDKARKP